MKQYKPLGKRGTHAHFKNVCYAAVQTNKTFPIKHENKRNTLRFDRMFDDLQILANTTKYDQTAPNKVSGKR